MFNVREFVTISINKNKIRHNKLNMLVCCIKPLSLHFDDLHTNITDARLFEKIFFIFDVTGCIESYFYF